MIEFALTFMLPSPPMQLEDYLTIPEAAEILNVSEGRVRQLVMTGQLESQKIGPTLIPLEAVTRRVQNLRRQTLKQKKSNGNK